MKVSIKEVAARAGVSTGTVSNVFNGKTTVKPALAERVRRVAQDLGYEPNRVAAQLRGRPARVVAALVPDLNNPFFTNLLASLERSARESGFDLIVASSNSDPAEEKARLSALLAWHPAGVIVVPCSDEFRCRTLLEQRGVPFVIADRCPPDYRGDAVTLDNVDAGRLAADHLVQLGHRNILVVASSLRILNIRERCEGIRQVFAAHGLEPPRIVEIGHDFDKSSEILSRAIPGDPRPTALLALTAFATLGILAALQRRGLNVPSDMSVLGFDDYSWMQAVNPPLTSILQPVEAMGRESWARLRSRIQGSTEPPVRIQLQCTRMERASTSSMRNAAKGSLPEDCIGKQRGNAARRPA